MVAKFLELNTFFIETAICSVKRGKKSVGCCFVPECNHTQESRARQVFLFLMRHLQDHGLLRSRNFATMATPRDDFSSLLSRHCHLSFKKIKLLKVYDCANRLLSTEHLS